MTARQFEDRLIMIDGIGSREHLVDGFTYQEYEKIMDAIGKQEKCAFDIVAIWTRGIKIAYPRVYEKYFEMFEMEDE